MSIENIEEQTIITIPLAEGRDIWEKNLSKKEIAKREDTLSKIEQEEKKERQEEFVNLPNIDEAYEATTKGQSSSTSSEGF